MIITPALLERKDTFLYVNSLYRVLRIDGGRVYFAITNDSGFGGGVKSTLSMSINSKQKLTLIKDGDFDCPAEDLHKHFKILPEGSNLVS